MLLILYNINPMPLAICALPQPTDPKQQGSDAKEEPQEKEIFVLARRKKNRRKLVCRVVIK